MAIQLAPNERLVKEWRYARSRKKRKNGVDNLIVTNRRVIYYGTENRKKTIVEVLIEKCRSWRIATSRVPKWLINLLIILGCLAIVGGIVLMCVFLNQMKGMACLYLLVSLAGIILILIGVWLSHKLSFRLLLETEGVVRTEMVLGGSVLFRNSLGRRSIVMINIGDAVDDILSGFGAALIAAKNQ